MNVGRDGYYKTADGHTSDHGGHGTGADIACDAATCGDSAEEEGDAVEGLGEMR